MELADHRLLSRHRRRVDGGLRRRRATQRGPCGRPAAFRRPAFSGANVAILTFNLGTFGVFLYTSLFFQNVLGYSPVKAGSALLPWILVLIILGPLTGTLAERVTPRWLIAGGLLVMACGLALLTGINDAQRIRRPAARPACSAGSAARSRFPSAASRSRRRRWRSRASPRCVQHGARDRRRAGHRDHRRRRRIGPGRRGRSVSDAFAAGYSHGIAVAAVLAATAAFVAALTLGDRRDARAAARP